MTTTTEETMKDVNVRAMPIELWHRVRRAAAGVGPTDQSSIRAIVILALEEWLTRRGW